MSKCRRTEDPWCCPPGRKALAPTPCSIKITGAWWGREVKDLQVLSAGCIQSRGLDAEPGEVCWGWGGGQEEKKWGSEEYMTGSTGLPKVLLKTHRDHHGVTPRPTDSLLQDWPHHPSIPQPARGQRMPGRVGVRAQDGPGLRTLNHQYHSPKGEDQDGSRAWGWAEEGAGQRGHEDSRDRVRTSPHSWAKGSAL